MNKEFIKIGLCGRSGSGKGYISEIFGRYGIPSVDTDKVYREIISEKGSLCLAELRENFGECIITKEGELSRKELGRIVFSDPEKLKLLNKITHKYILERTEAVSEEYEKSGCKAVLIDAPVLFESGFDKICDIRLCVTCDDEKSVERICKRDGIDRADAEKRLASQISAELLRKLCDYEIVNDDISDPEEEVLRFLRHYSLI